MSLGYQSSQESPNSNKILREVSDFDFKCIRKYTTINLRPDKQNSNSRGHMKQKPRGIKKLRGLFPRYTKHKPSSPKHYFAILKKIQSLTKKSKQSTLRIVSFDGIIKTPNNIVSTRRLSTAKDNPNPEKV